MKHTKRKKTLLCLAVLSYAVFLGSLASSLFGKPLCPDKRGNTISLVALGATAAILSIAFIFSQKQLKGDDMPKKTKNHLEEQKSDQQVSINQISVELNDIINPQMKLEDELVHLGFPHNMLEKLDENLKEIESEGKLQSEHKRYYNEVFHKKYRVLSAKCHPDKFLGSIKGIAREVGDERQKRLNAVSEAMKNIQYFCLRKRSYLMSYKACAQLSVAMATSEEVKDLHNPIIWGLRHLSEQRQTSLMNERNYYILNAEDIVEYYQKKLRAIVKGNRKEVEKIERNRKDYVEKTQTTKLVSKDYEYIDKIKTLEIESLQEEYNDHYNEHYISNVEYLLKKCTGDDESDRPDSYWRNNIRGGVLAPMRDKVEKLFKESKEQAEILNSCTQLFTPASLKKWEIRQKWREYRSDLPHDPLAYHPYIDKDFVLPMVEYSNVIYLYKVLCDKLKNKKHIETISLKNLKSVRDYIDQLGLKDIHEFCNELITHYCSFGFDQVQGFLKTKEIEIENKDQLYAIFVTSLKSYGDLLVQEFKEGVIDCTVKERHDVHEAERKVSNNVVITRDLEGTARANERLARANERLARANERLARAKEFGEVRKEFIAAMPTRGTAEFEEKYLKYIEHTIRYDFTLALDACDENTLLTAQLSKNLELIVNYMMVGIGDNQQMIPLGLIIHMVDFVVEQLESQLAASQEINFSLAQEVVRDFLAKEVVENKYETPTTSKILAIGKQVTEEQIEEELSSIATEIEEKKTDHSMILQEALKASGLPYDILEQLDENLTLVKREKRDITEHFQFFNELVKKPLGNNDPCLAMVNLRFDSENNDFKYQEYASVNINLLTYENALSVLHNLSKEEKKLIKCRDKFLVGDRSVCIPGVHGLLEQLLAGKKGKIEEQLFKLQKSYVEAYSRYYKGLEKLNKEDESPEIKRLLIESRKQLEILKYESFNYIEGGVNEVADILQLQCNYKIEEVDEHFVLPAILYSNFITKLSSGNVQRPSLGLKEFPEIARYILNCSLNELGKVCHYSVDYYCNGNINSKKKLSDLLEEKNIDSSLKDETIKAMLVAGLSQYSQLLTQESPLKIAAAKLEEMRVVNSKADKIQNKDLRDIIKNSFIEKIPINNANSKYPKLWWMKYIHQICILLSDLIMDSIMDGTNECQSLTMADIDVIASRVMDELKGDSYEIASSMSQERSSDRAYKLLYIIRITGMGGKFIYDEVDEYMESEVEPLKKVEGFTMAIINGMDDEAIRALNDDEFWQQASTRSLVYRTLDTIRTNMGHDLCGKKMHRREMYDFEPKKHLGQIKTFYKKIKQVVENVVEEEGLKIPSLFSYEKGKSIKEDIVRKEMEEQIAREFAELKAELIEFENRPDVIEQRRIKAEQEEEQEKIINELAELRRKAYPIFREKVSKFEDKLQDIIKTIENKDNKIVEAIIHYVKDNGQYSVEQVMNAVITEIELNKEQIIKEVTELSKHKEEKMRGLKAYEKEEQRSCEIEKTRGIYQLIDKFINAGIARFNISENNIDELSQNSESKQTEPDKVVDEVKVEEGVDVVLDLVSQAGPSWKM